MLSILTIIYKQIVSLILKKVKHNTLKNVDISPKYCIIDCIFNFYIEGNEINEN